MNYIDTTDFEQGCNYINKEFNLVYDYKSNDEMIIYKDDIMFNRIGIERQKTGFGYKRLFVCNECKTRHTRLYLTGKGFVCRNCTDVDIYAARKNMYDEDMQIIIRLKIAKLLKALKGDPGKKYAPIDVSDCIPLEKPKYMHDKTYSITVMRIYFLDWIYWQIQGGNTYTIREINSMLEEHNTRFVWEHILFRCYYPGAVALLNELENE